MSHKKKYDFAEDQIEAIIDSLNAKQCRTALVQYAKNLLRARISGRRLSGCKKWRPGGRGPVPTELRKQYR